MGLCDEKRPLNELQVYRVVEKKIIEKKVWKIFYLKSRDEVQKEWKSKNLKKVKCL